MNEIWEFLRLKGKLRILFESLLKSKNTCLDKSIELLHSNELEFLEIFVKWIRDASKTMQFLYKTHLVFAWVRYYTVS